MFCLQINNCEVVACFNPEIIVNMYNTWTGRPIQFYDTVTYGCNQGYYFEDDRYREFVTVTCTPWGTYQYNGDGEMPKCVQGM